MPARSNDFQLLVRLVKQNLSDGEVVTESRMLSDNISRKPVEVDVCVEGKVAGDTVLVCIECRDRSRKADLNWVHEMKAKHDRLPTNALILAHAKGFTRRALEVAKDYGIRTVTLEETENPQFPAILGREMALWAKTFSIRAERVWFVVEALNELPEERVRISPNQSIFDVAGNQLGPADRVVAYILNSQVATHWFGENGKAEHTWYQVEWNIGQAVGELPLYLEKREPRCLRRIQRIEIAGPCAYTVNGLKLRRGRLGSTQLAWGKTKLFGQDAMVVATRDELGVEKITVHVAGASMSEAFPEPETAAQAVASYR